MAQNQTKPRSQTKLKLIIDIGIFIGFLIAMEPHASGLTIHEWLATALIAVLIVHLLLSWDWITQITRRFIGRMNRQSRINYILNWLLFIDGTIIMLSGFMISESLMPALGIQLPHNFAWRSLHDLSANLFLILLGLHTALHWNWIVDAFKRFIFQPLVKLLPETFSKGYCCMKIVGRILIILAVLALVMGITYVIVNTRGSSAPGFEPGNERFSASNGAPPGFPEAGPPEFPGGGRNEFRGERGGGGWLLEALKNIAIIGIIVALIVVPKSWMQKRKKATQTPAG